jgi:hypothetical protein
LAGYKCDTFSEGIAEKVVATYKVIDFYKKLSLSGKGDTEGFIFHNLYLNITFS